MVITVPCLLMIRVFLSFKLLLTSLIYLPCMDIWLPVWERGRGFFRETSFVGLAEKDWILSVMLNYLTQQDSLELIIYQKIKIRQEGYGWKSMTFIPLIRLKVVFTLWHMLLCWEIFMFPKALLIVL